MAGENGVGNDSLDRISGLPDGIRELILGYLPIADSVRTSLLSRKWRYNWTRAVQLNIQFGKDMYRDSAKDAESSKYYRVVANALLTHVGRIHKFVLCLIDCPFDGDLNAWVLFLSRKGIKELTIYRLHGIECTDLPSSVYQCLELSCLALGKINLKRSIAFRGFPNLVSLCLHNVNIYGDIYEKIISSCPLEILVLHRCSFFLSLTDLHHRKTDIRAPNLRALMTVCDCISSCYGGLSYTPHLKVASFTTSRVDATDCFCSNCFDVLGSLHEIEDLTLDCWMHKVPLVQIVIFFALFSLLNSYLNKLSCHI